MQYLSELNNYRRREMFNFRTYQTSTIYAALNSILEFEVIEIHLCTDGLGSIPAKCDFSIQIVFPCYTTRIRWRWMEFFSESQQLCVTCVSLRDHVWTMATISLLTLWKAKFIFNKYSVHIMHSIHITYGIYIRAELHIVGGIVQFARIPNKPNIRCIEKTFQALE